MRADLPAAITTGMTTHTSRQQRARALDRAVFSSVFLAIAMLVSSARPQDAPADQAKIEAGENVYNNNCQTCHGDGLVNTGQTFDLRRLTAADRPRFENSVRNGKNQMPPWQDVLNDADIDAVWIYIRSHAYKK